MATINRKPAPLRTHEGGVAKHITALDQLKRTICACLLWEDGFYESGAAVADRIASLVPVVDAAEVARLAIEARSKHNLRHAPLLIVREMARHKWHRHLVADTLAGVIQRPDELTEFLAIYWKDGRQPLSGQVKKGLAAAFSKFDEYRLAKYNRDGAIKLRDVLFLCHAKPEGAEQEALWKRLVDGELVVPDTWEVALSAGADKKATWERLVAEGKLGAMALLRNLRNMEQVGVEANLIESALLSAKVSKVLPFRFIAAARYAPRYEPSLESLMLLGLSEFEKLEGRTILLVDVSGSMDVCLSNKSDMSRLDAACGIAVMAREVCSDCRVMTFSDKLVEVPPRRGFALRDAIVQSQKHSGTYLGAALSVVPEHDRLIVFTDEQSHDCVPDPRAVGYMINVAVNKNGVGYGPWIHIDGFSESIIRFIAALES